MIKGGVTRRVFVYAGIKLADIDPKKTPEEIKQAYVVMYPELANAGVGHSEFVGTTQQIHFVKAVGVKG